MAHHDMYSDFTAAAVALLAERNRSLRTGSDSPRRSVTWDLEEGKINGGEPPVHKRSLCRLLSNPRDELQRFRISLLWIGLDQSTPVRIAFSWIVFLLFAIVLPVINSVAISCSDCYHRQLPFERLVYVSESALAIVSFSCLSFLLRKHGLRKVLMLEKLDRESQEVQQHYRAKVSVRVS